MNLRQQIKPCQSGLSRQEEPLCVLVDDLSGMQVMNLCRDNTDSFIQGIDIQKAVVASISKLAFGFLQIVSLS